MENLDLLNPNDYTGEIIDFHALHTAYCEFEWARHYINAIYACTAIYCYWSRILDCQLRNGSSDDLDFISRNMNSYVESRSTVMEKIRKAVLGVVRMATATNCTVTRNGGKRFLICRLNRDGIGHYDYAQAELLTREIAYLFEKYHGEEITKTRWDTLPD